MALEGGCACGGVRYRLADAPMFVNCCHCTDCQTETGSAFVINALIEADRVELLGGAPEAVYDDVQFSGKPTLAFGSPDYVFDCPKGKLLNATLHCDGLGVRAEKISAALLINPGKVEAGEDHSTKVLP